MAAKTLLTEAEFDNLPRPERWPKLELSDGELIVTATPRLLHNRVRERIGISLANFCEASGAGEVVWEIEFKLAQGTIRVPDIAFLRAARVAEIDPSDRLQGAPDIAVEVVSPSNTAQDMEKKVQEFLRAGGPLVWVVYPEARRVHVYRAGERVEILEEGQTLSALALLPGWSIPLAKLFAHPGRR